MLTNATYAPIDYLLIGHITHDLKNGSYTPGGTVTFSGITAKALGYRVGIVTSLPDECDYSYLDGIQVHRIPAAQPTTFKNIQTDKGREQLAFAKAEILDYPMIPLEWRDTPIVHLGPVLQEVDLGLLEQFPKSFVGVTPQGWLRNVEDDNRVTYLPWTDNLDALSLTDATIISVEDVRGDEDAIEAFAQVNKVLVVTEGYNGARLYWNGDVRSFTAPKVTQVDPTGAGDIFAASFFTRLCETKNPWEAAKFAVSIASASVSRPGLAGIPTRAEINQAKVEVL